MAGHPFSAAVVIAAYNEAQALPHVLKELIEEFPEFLVVVVDDGSSDSTYDVARRARVHSLRHPVNLGQGAALQTGIEYALKQGVDYIITFDADGQHRPEDIRVLLSALAASDAEVALGSRFLSAEGQSRVPWSRRLLLRLAARFTRLATGMRVTDAHNGLRAMRASAAARLRLEMNGMAHASEILEQIARLNLRWTEVPVTIHYTVYSRQKGQRVSNLVNILWDLWWRR